MTISCTDRGTAASNASSSTTYAFSPGTNLAAGSTAVLCISADNSVTGGATNNITSVTDSLGNTWIIVQAPIFDNGTASQGVQGAIAYTTMGKGTLTTGATITVTFGTATTAKSYTLHEVVPTSGLIATYKKGGVGTGSAVGAGAAYSMTTGSIAVGNLLICTLAMESGTTQTYTADSDSTNGTWSTVQYSEVGSTTSGNCIGSQYKVQTTTGSTQSYDATLAAAADSIGAWAEFEEVNPVVLKGTQDQPAPSRKKQSGFIEYGQNLLLTTLAVAATGNYLARAPLYTPLRSKPKVQQVEPGPNLLTTTLAGGAPVTVALSGEVATVSAGTLGPQTSIALAGQAATASAGTLTPVTSSALAGQSAAASAGTLAPEIARALSGEAVTASAGTLTATSGITQALTGQSVTASAGTLAVTTTVPLSGQAATASAGTLTSDVARGLSGQAVTASSGTLAAAISIALTGEAVTATAGALTADAGVTNLPRGPLYTPVRTKGRTQQPELTPNLLTTTLAGSNVTLGLTGQVVTVSAGTLTAVTDTVPFKPTAWPEQIRTSGYRQIEPGPNLLETTLGTVYELNARIDWGNPERSVKRRQPTETVNLLLTTLAGTTASAGLSGQAITASAGTLAPAISIALVGSQVTVSAGTLTAQSGSTFTVALTGQVVAADTGALGTAIANALTGISVTSSAGALIAGIGLTGAQVTTSAGSVGISVTVTLTGQDVVASAGILSPPYMALIAVADRVISADLAGRTIAVDSTGRIITVGGKGRTIS